MVNKRKPTTEQPTLFDGLEDQEKARQTLERTLAAPLVEAPMDERTLPDYSAKAAEHRRKMKEQAPARRMARLEQLHLVESKSVMPNLAAKTGLFAPVRPGRRKFVREYEPVHVWGLPGVGVAYKHEQLNQLDLNVFLLLVSFARRRGENYAAFTRREALKALRMNDSGFSYKVFDKYIDRLGSTRVEISVSGERSGGQGKRYALREVLAPRDYHEEREGLYVVELSRALQGFFAVDDWSIISLPTRLELGQNQWALAVHAFITANRSPAWFTWDQIHLLWGQGYSDLYMLRRDFRRRVIKPLKDIGFLKRVDEKKTTAIGLWW
jgi:hypothetical protein